MFRFTVRELMLVSAITALAAGWWLCNHELMKKRVEYRELEDRYSALVLALESGWKMKVEVTPSLVIVDDPTGVSCTTAWKPER